MSPSGRRRVDKLEYVGGQLGPVKNADTHISHEDIVEWSLVQPRTLDVVDLEFHIRWQPSSR